MLVKDNTHIPAEDKDFFILLRIGLWQKVEEPLSDSPDWPYIYRLACEQTVQGIVADGMGLYRAAYERGDFGITPFPSGEGWEEASSLFLSQSAQIIRQNYIINRGLQQLSQQLSRSSITALVVKGQAIAQSYPKPMLRCSGDIDLFLDDDYERCKQFLQSLSTCVMSENTKLVDQGFMIDGIEVEAHGQVNPNLGSRVRDVLVSAQHQMFQHHDFAYFNCSGVQVAKPSASFDALYIFLHCLQHFCYSGLGIRQICDWSMHISTNRSEIKIDELQSQLHQMHLTHAWNTFMCFVEHYLGLESSKTIYFGRHDDLHPAIIWDSIKHSGNMGHHSYDGGVTTHIFWFFRNTQISTRIALRMLVWKVTMMMKH